MPLGVRLFSQRGYHSPVLEFLVLWSYSIDGLSLHSLQVDIIIRGSCLVQIRNRQKIPSWPGDFKRWMRVIHEELETWCIIIGLYFWWFMSYKRAFLHDPVVLMIKNKIQRSEWGSVRFKARSLKISQQQNGLKLLLYWFQSKRISTPWTGIIKHVISRFGSVRDGLRCNRWIVSNDLFREKMHLLTRIESQKKDLIRSRTKWKKASESAYHTNALGSIVLLLSLLNVLFNNITTCLMFLMIH
ncbi:hypothetical protein HID58_060128, partial [Brassica napus]